MTRRILPAKAFPSAIGAVMHRFVGLSALLLFVACITLGQTASRSSSSIDAVTWEPQAWAFLQEYPKATVSKQMVAALRVSNLLVRLENTTMEDVKATLGGTIGKKGDAGDFDEWLCFHGSDPSGGWVLWLESGEIDGGTVGSFQWQRLSASAVLDRRCRVLGEAKVKLPIALQLGITEAEVLKILGRPTVKQGDRLIYLHEHPLTIRGEPSTSDNVVAILLRGGRVWAIEVSKTTVS